MTAVLIATIAALGVAQSPGPGTLVLLVTGLSGEPAYAASFATSAGLLYDAAKTRWGVADSSLFYLAEQPAADTARIRGKATRQAVLGAIAALTGRARPDDVVLIVLFGHGSQQGDQARLSLPGPDLTAQDLALALEPLAKQTVVVVNTASASGGFVAPLSGPRRIVLTATKTGFERNATQFGEFFARGLAGGQADTDKDGRISVAEAFQFARAEVARAYESSNRLLTEHAQLDDNGDKIATASLETDAADGRLARAIAFSVSVEPLIDDPRAAGLLAERRRLEVAIAELRQRKVSMDSVAYERELETLLVTLAETNRALRALGPDTP